MTGGSVAERPGRVVDRIDGLDGLRGVAALIVVIHHAGLVTPALWAAHERLPAPLWSRLVMFGPFHILVAGEEMVRLFFVLSGFVLSLPFWIGPAPAYRRFAMKRMFRLYPPYLVAVLASASLALIIGHADVAGTSDWFAPFWADGVSWSALWRAIVMTGGAFTSINTVIWSLIVEVRVSLLFPLIMLATRRLGVGALAIMLLMAFVAARLLNTQIGQHEALREILQTITYIWLFVLGALIARHRPDARRLVEDWSWSRATTALAFAAALLIARYVAPIPAPIATFATGIGAGLIVLLVSCHPGLADAFAGRLARLLGRISYSLYLVHFPIIVGTVFLLGERLPLPLVLLVAVTSALIVAYGFCVAVEEPAIRLSRRLPGRIVGTITFQRSRS